MDESMDMPASELEKALETLLNRHNAEALSNTPDFILAAFLTRCLEAWNTCIARRDRWYKNDSRELREAIDWELEITDQRTIEPVRCKHCGELNVITHIQSSAKEAHHDQEN